VSDGGAHAIAAEAPATSTNTGSRVQEGSAAWNLATLWEPGTMVILESGAEAPSERTKFSLPNMMWNQHSGFG